MSRLDSEEGGVGIDLVSRSEWSWGGSWTSFSCI